MCGVQLKYRIKDTDSMLSLNKAVDQLAIANNVYLYDHVLRREDGPVLRRSLEFEVEGQREKGRLRWTWKKQVVVENMKVGLCSVDVL